MGLSLFFESQNTTPDRKIEQKGSKSVGFCSCCLHERCTGSRGLLFCEQLVLVIWVMRWYDPWNSLQDTIAACLGHERFSYWGSWTPSGVGRSGVCKLIIRADYPWVKFGRRDLVSLARPRHPDSIFCLERCSAQRISCCLTRLRMPLYELQLALLQEGSFPVGNEALRTFLNAEFVALGV
jgi:hypothetical protein